MESESTVYTKQQRIAALAEQMPGLSFTSLNHYLDMDWMKEAYRRTRKDGAAGVDGQTAKEYEQDLEEHLRDLLERAKSGRYRAPAVKRVYIPKGNRGETRPIGIPTLEDKVLQRAIAMVMEPIYEHDFHECSYGFRPGRSAHQAVQVIWDQTMRVGGGWVVDADISKFFDTLNHGHLRTFLERRVRDGVVRRLIGKWLKAGVMEEGDLWYPEGGTPQGGVISPFLSNIYLHEVLDVWFAEEVKPRMRGQAFLVRYADDFIIGLEYEEDAREVMAIVTERFAQFGLTIHPTKTQLVDFRRPRNGTRGGSFNFLGFTHYWGESRRGRLIVKRKTAKARFSQSLKAVGQWCRKNRHRPIEEQQKALNRKLTGHYRYYGITNNGRSLGLFLYEVQRVWRKWLNRRSRERDMTWEKFNRLFTRYTLAPVRIYNSVYAAA